MQLFKLERHSTRDNGSGSAEKFNDKLHGVVLECLCEGVTGADIQRVLMAVGNQCDMFGPSCRLPSLSWITKIRLDIPTFVASQIKDFVENSDHLVLGTDDTSLRQKKIASYGLHNHEGEYMTIAMKNTSATCGDQIAEHLMAVIEEQPADVREMIKTKLKGVITDRGPAAESGAKKFVSHFNQLHRHELPKIFVLPCLFHTIANGVNYIASELSEDAKVAMARVRRIFGDRETGNFNKHSLCEAFKIYTQASYGSPFQSNLGCRFEHWPINGQNLIDFEMIVRDLLDNKKSLSSEQEALKKLMEKSNWESSLLECGAVFALYEHLLLPFDIAVKPSDTNVNQLKTAMNQLLTRINVAQTIGLEGLISIIQDLYGGADEDQEKDGAVVKDKKSALKKLDLLFKNASAEIQKEIDDFINRAVKRLRLKIDKDFKMINEALETGLADDLVVPFHNRASERSFSIMKAINKKIPTMTDDNSYNVSIARQNHLGSFLSSMSDVKGKTNEARSKRKELMMNRRARHNRLAKDKLAAEFNFVDLFDE